MDAKIKSIILWPKNGANSIRKIEFKCRGVEVISGWSQKGKSALVQIVDYCLGSEKCAIPIGKVRDTVEWFGIVLALPRKRIVVGRRNPGNSASSGDMFWLEGRDVEIPDNPERFVSRESVVDRLNQLAALPTQSPGGEESNSFDGPPSFRDLAAFSFQPQHIIANPYTLFYKADTSVHREKLIRSVFPYVLGAVDANTLADQSRLRRLEQELRLKREVLDQQQRASEMWKGKLQSFAASMQQYGLLAPDLRIADLPVPKLVEVLRPVPAKWKDAPQFQELDGIAKQVRRHALSLQAEETRLNREIGDAERKIRKMSRLQVASDGYRASMLVQEERLAPSLWLEKRMVLTQDCPLCGGRSHSGERVQQLIQAAKNVAATVKSFKPVDEALNTEIRRHEDSTIQKRRELSSIESQIQDMEQKNENLKSSRSRRDAVGILVGQLKAILETIDAANPSGKVQKEANELEKEVKDISKRVNYYVIRKKTDEALSSISRLIGHYAGILQVEHSDQTWALDDKNLTLSTKGSDKTDYLWEIGSAANWMGYHVATLLALHEHFRSVPYNPVPKFLMIDQPSQAFFPEGISEARKRKDRKVSDDLKRLQRLFKTLSEAITRTKNGLQIILLEHAEPETWTGIPHFSMPDGEWRGDGALIPADWA